MDIGYTKGMVKMKFLVERTSDYYNKSEKAVEIYIKTLEELINWCKNTENDVIIKLNGKTPTLEIYDDWRE